MFCVKLHQKKANAKKLQSLVTGGCGHGKVGQGLVSPEGGSGGPGEVSGRGRDMFRPRLCLCSPPAFACTLSAPTLGPYSRPLSALLSTPLSPCDVARSFALRLCYPLIRPQVVFATSLDFLVMMASAFIAVRAACKLDCLVLVLWFPVYFE